MRLSFYHDGKKTIRRNIVTLKGEVFNSNGEIRSAGNPHSFPISISTTQNATNNQIQPKDEGLKSNEQELEKALSTISKRISCLNDTLSTLRSQLKHLQSELRNLVQGRQYIETEMKYKHIQSVIHEERTEEQNLIKKLEALKLSESEELLVNKLDLELANLLELMKHHELELSGNSGKLIEVNMRKEELSAKLEKTKRDLIRIPKKIQKLEEEQIKIEDEIKSINSKQQQLDNKFKEIEKKITKIKNSTNTSKMNRMKDEINTLKNEVLQHLSLTYNCRL
jgi:chromosome segregation ATPase